MSRAKRQSIWPLVVVIACVGLRTERTRSQDTADKPATAARAKAAWPQGLDSQRRRAKAEGRPLLVRAGADWCPWCEKLNEQMETAEVQAELRHWTLAYVDADKSDAEIGQLGVGPIPALRAIDVAGRVVGEHDGFLPHDELVEWLKKTYKLAAVARAEVLAGDATLEENDVVGLIDLLKVPSALEREAALRRLASHPNLAAPQVVETLARGKLAAQLSALELLNTWHAPADQLDPWRPETLNVARLEALRQWAQDRLKQGDQPSAPKISEEELAAAAVEVERLAEASDAQAEAINERLARFGPALLPLVTTRLKQAGDDAVRQRLLTLRYRLVASDGIALSWPGGLARLAATDANVRHNAAAELVDRVRAADEALLLELFADPDAIVREISLRGLQNVGGDASSAALLKLLDDPEPNVRAAVLKQLAESPSDNVAAKIAEFVASEKDSDLVVHAIRVLKEAKAVGPLTKLLKHESWQARAEAAESLAGLVSEQPSEARKADIYVAMIECLADTDPFVVSRAIHGLEGAELVAAAGPLVKAASDHPELAAEVIKALAKSPALRAKSEPFLRKSLGHPEPHVRASVISTLAEAEADDIDKVLMAGLQDAESQVREAAAEAMFKLFDAAMQQASDPSAAATRRYTKSQGGVFETIKSFFSPKSTPAEASKDKRDQGRTTDQAQDEPDDGKTGDAWLLAYQQGKTRPAWMNGAIGPLEKLLEAQSPRERLAAALALVPLGRDEQALKVLKELARTQPSYVEPASAALPWLPWAKRQEFFEELLRLRPHTEQLHEVTGNLVKNKTPRSIGLLWGLLAREQADERLAGVVYAALLGLYRGSGEDAFGQQPAAITKADKAQVKEFAEQGTPWQKTIALAMLVDLSADDAVELAQKTIADAGAADAFRGDAFRFWLLASEPNEASTIAVRHLTSADAVVRKPAILYLARGAEALQDFRRGMYVRSSLHPFDGGYNEVVSVEAPSGLTAEMVRPLLADSDPEVAASAGYLLATLGSDEGLPLLIRMWRKQDRFSNWVKSLYRAIAALDNDDHTPTLVEINRKLNQWEKRDFYWTIRAMHGPQVLKLRRQIRDEVGMDALR